MNRSQLEHVIRAASSIADDPEIVIVGSQAILGRYDVYPRNHPERAELVDGAIGELSAFHDTFGYYAHGVGPETAVLPTGWESRLVRIASPGTAGAVGLCLDPSDLALSKLVAGREKDLEYLRLLVSNDLVRVEDLLLLVESTPVEESVRELMRVRLAALRRSP